MKKLTLCFLALSVLVACEKDETTENSQNQITSQNEVALTAEIVTVSKNGTLTPFYKVANNSASTCGIFDSYEQLFSSRNLEAKIVNINVDDFNETNTDELIEFINNRPGMYVIESASNDAALMDVTGLTANQKSTDIPNIMSVVLETQENGDVIQTNIVENTPVVNTLDFLNVNFSDSNGPNLVYTNTNDKLEKSIAKNTYSNNGFWTNNLTTPRMWAGNKAPNLDRVNIGWNISIPARKSTVNAVEIISIGSRRDVHFETNMSIQAVINKYQKNGFNAFTSAGSAGGKSVSPNAWNELKVYRERKNGRSYEVELIRGTPSGFISCFNPALNQNVSLQQGRSFTRSTTKTFSIGGKIGGDIFKGKVEAAAGFNFSRTSGNTTSYTSGLSAAAMGRNGSIPMLRQSMQKYRGSIVGNITILFYKSGNLRDRHWKFVHLYIDREGVETYTSEKPLDYDNSGKLLRTADPYFSVLYQGGIAPNCR